MPPQSHAMRTFTYLSIPLCLLTLAACDPQVSPPIPEVDAGPEGPCSAPTEPGAIRRLCVWAHDDDLARLYEDPVARVEIETETSVDGLRFSRSELEIHGGFARLLPKKSYRIRFDEPVALDWFGDGEVAVERLVLQAAYVDPTFLRARLAMDLMREEGGLAPRIDWVTLYINGEYQGLYQLIERIDESYFERQGLSPTGSYYKAESHAANWGVHTDPVEGFAVDGDPDDLASFLRSLASTPATHDDFQREVEPLLDVEDFITWNAVMIYSMNVDTFTKNYYLYHDAMAAPGTYEGRWHVIAWDADGTFANSWDGAPLAPDEYEWWRTDYNVFVVRFFGIEAYRERYLERLEASITTGRFTTAAMRERVAPLAARLREEASRDLAHWERGLTYEDELMRLDEFLAARPAIMQAVIDAARD